MAWRSISSLLDFLHLSSTGNWILYRKSILFAVTEAELEKFDDIFSFDLWEFREKNLYTWLNENDATKDMIKSVFSVLYTDKQFLELSFFQMSQMS